MTGLHTHIWVGTTLVHVAAAEPENESDLPLVCWPHDGKGETALQNPTLLKLVGKKRKKKIVTSIRGYETLGTDPSRD